MQVEITPTQEGTGDPSPENVRPIVGWDSVNVTRCGKNLLDISNMQTITKGGVTFQLENGGIHVSGTATNNVDSPIFKMFLPSGTYINNMKKANFSWLQGSSFVVQRSDGTNYYYTASNPFTINEDEKPLYWYFIVENGVTVNEIVYPQIELGSTTTAYEPYQGNTYTVQLGQTIYGGTLDAVTGEGQETWKFITLNGTESWYTWGINANNPAVTGFYTYDIADYDDINAKGICSQFAPGAEVWGGRNVGFGFATTGESRYLMYCMPTSLLPDISAGNEVASFKAYLAAQYAAGTPVQICYKLAAPEPFQATGSKPIPALPGTNTIYTDAGNITVTGASDPIATITALQSRVSALESAALN